jgi:putative SOS response-associated peptidase YedK
MCGRFTLATPNDQLIPLFDLDEVTTPPLAPRYNIAPTQDVAVVRLPPGGGKRQLELLRWGLIPSWAKDADIGNRLINARSETVGEKPAFRQCFRQRRCLIPADGFYEWAKIGSGKQPYLFRLRAADPFALAGLWDAWHVPGGESVQTCTILTTDANDVVRPVHPRMPVILAREAYDLWLDPAIDRAEILAPLFRPFDPGLLVGFRVSSRVNSPAIDDADCVAPL